MDKSLEFSAFMNHMSAASLDTDGQKSQFHKIGNEKTSFEEFYEYLIYNLDTRINIVSIPVVKQTVTSLKYRLTSLMREVGRVEPTKEQIKKIDDIAEEVSNLYEAIIASHPDHKHESSIE